jgi:kynureninase
LVYKPNDVIIYFDTIYGGIEKTLASILETTPNLQVRKVGYGQDFAYSLPCTHAEILNAFSQTISRLLYDGLTPKVAIFDTIVSLPGVRFPFERLTKMCKEYGILSVIDGAHGVGQIPLNLGALDADFFVSNCHK